MQWQPAACAWSQWRVSKGKVLLVDRAAFCCCTSPVQQGFNLLWKMTEVETQHRLHMVMSYLASWEEIAFRVLCATSHRGSSLDPVFWEVLQSLLQRAVLFLVFQQLVSTWWMSAMWFWFRECLFFSWYLLSCHACFYSLLWNFFVAFGIMTPFIENTILKIICSFCKYKKYSMYPNLWVICASTLSIQYHS